MRVSYKWLGDYVDLSGVTPEELADRLTLAGLEIEEVFDRFEPLESVVVGRIVSCEPLAGSDHLSVCRVDDGTGEWTVICGAPNARAGLLSSYARPGTELPTGQTVSETVIRGVESRGMLCSEAELMISQDHSGIMELAADAEPGRPITKVLGLCDVVYEIGVTPNRPDALSVIGVAREAAALLGRELKYPEFTVPETGDDIRQLTSVTIRAPEHCPRYTARVIRDVVIGPSPDWLAERIAAAGSRPINNVVDITNFVMLEMGQPLHAFDMDLLEEGRIEVALAKEGDHFITLDDQERILGAETLMICDGKKPVGLAGVMGGQNTEILDTTSNVLLESAYFTPTGVRRTAKFLGLSTEASFRFERGCDPEGCVRAADRAAYLMAELAQGKVAQSVIDEYPLPQPQIKVSFDPDKCNAFLGSTFSTEEMIDVMERVGISRTDQDGGPIVMAVPPWRNQDVLREVDLYEEVGRLLGFDRIPPTIPAVRAEMKPHSESWQVRFRARSILEGLGFFEVINYSFISEDFADRLGLPEAHKLRRAVRIINPLSDDQVLMRTTLAPSLLDTLRRNLHHFVRRVMVYEIGAVYYPVDGQELPDEKWTIGGLLDGWRNDPSLHDGVVPEFCDFWDAKGAVEELLDGLGVAGYRFRRGETPSWLEEAAAAEVMAGDTSLGWVGKVKKTAAEKFGLLDSWRADQATYLFELDVESLLAVRASVPHYSSLPRYPAVDRDMTINVAADLEAARVKDFINGLNAEYLEDVFPVAVFDREDRVGAGRKNLSFRLVFRAPERTLTAEEANEMHESLVGRVLAEFEGTRA